MAALLREALRAPAVPGGLVPALQAALARAGATQGAAPGLRALLRLLWAEARFLPLSFFVLQVVLLALALAANRYLTGPAGAGPLPAWLEGAPRDLVARALLRDALGRSADALTLLAPWLGTGVAIFAVLPRRHGLWADLEALSPFSGPTRLLARTSVATLVVLAATTAAGLVSPGARVGAPGVLLLLARTAPLFLAVSWALAWSLPFGAPGAVVASLALWGGLTWFGSGLGRWDLFAPPGAAHMAPAQALALAAGLAFFAVAWAQARRLEGRQPGASP
jgi:hypothetical protein